MRNSHNSEKISNSEGKSGPGNLDLDPKGQPADENAKIGSYFEINYFSSSTIIDIEATKLELPCIFRKAEGMWCRGARETGEPRVTIRDCYQKGTFSQLSLLFKILVVFKFCIALSNLYLTQHITMTEYNNEACNTQYFSLIEIDPRDRKNFRLCSFWYILVKINFHRVNVSEFRYQIRTVSDPHHA